MMSTLFEYIRNLSKDDKKNLSQKGLKVAEEVGELAKVLLPYDNAFATNHRFITTEQILEEVADTVLCALSVAYHLDFSTEDIFTMMQRKSEKWQLLQQNERDLKYPVPFEIHVTFKPLHAVSVEAFKAVCVELQVKPILLDLHTSSGKIIQDVMTSSTHFGTNASAYEEAMRIHDYASACLPGYEVKRVKIESVPWHPASPKFVGDVMPVNCYFEAHFALRFSQHVDNIKTLKEFLKDSNVYVSRNVFKVEEDGTETIMVTYRTAEDTQAEFETDVKQFEEHMKSSLHELKGLKIHKEFSVYDTNISHDNIWMIKQ